MAFVEKAEDSPVATEGFVLELTQEEAQVLFDITGCIGGHPSESRRKYVDNIRRAMWNAGFNDSRRGDMNRTVNRAIYFRTPQQITEGVDAP